MRLQGDRGRAVEVMIVVVIIVMVSSGQQRDSAIRIHQSAICQYKQKVFFFFLKRTLLGQLITLEYRT